MPNSEELRNLHEAVAELNGIAKAFNEHASNDRFLIQGAIQTLQHRVEVIASRVEQLVETVAQQSTIIRDFENERHEKAGAAGAVKFIWGALIVGISGVAYVLHDVITYVLPPKH